MTPRIGRVVALAVSLILSGAAVHVLAQTAIENPRAKRDINIITAPQGPAIIQTDKGTIIINNIQGIDPKDYQAIAAELGVTHAALDSFFRIIAREKVPLADLDATLREIAHHYEALLTRVQTLSTDDPEVARLHATAKEAIRTGHFDRAEALLNDASAKELAAAETLRVLAMRHQLSAAASLAATGDLKLTQFSYATAAEYYQRAAALVPSDEAQTRAEYLNQQGIASLEAGHYAAAQQPLEQALALREQALHPEHPAVAQSLNNLAKFYHTRGRYEEAEPLYQRALAIYAQVWRTPPAVVAASLSNLAELYYTQGRYEEAEPLHQRALAIREQLLGVDHPHTAISLNNLGLLYYAQGRYREAEPLYQRALTITERVLGPQHPHTDRILENYAALLHAANRHAEAAELEARLQALRSARGRKP